MGVAICCLNTFNKEIKNEKKIIFKPSPEQINKIEKIVKLQKNIRKFLSVLKFQIYFNEAKTKVINELDQKKLMNQNNVTECESEKFYQKLISKEKIQEFTKNNNFNKFYSNLSKYSFSIPYYIVTSPIEVYKGSWNLNKRYHGYGIKFEFDLKQNRNKRTEGIFFDGFLTGQGLVITSEGEIFMGNFIRNKLDGEGEHYRKDNSIYKGEFKNGKYDGLGKEIFNDNNNSKNSSIFEGFYQDGEKKYGKFEWSNGCQYQGNFFKNLFHGKGKYNWNEHKYYDGTWDKGEINGNGKFVYNDGSFYEGEFIKGKKFGKGKYVWNENKYYDGNWKNDKQNGYGIYYYNGKITEGYWINGKIANKVRNNNLTMINKNNTYIKGENKNSHRIKKSITEGFIYHKKKKSITPNKINNNCNKQKLNYNFDQEIKLKKILNENNVNNNNKNNISYSTSHLKTQNTIDSSNLVKTINP